MQISPAGYGLPEKNNRVIKKVLGKEDFLQLLVAQLKHQNPLEPQSNEQFIAQMAQFTSLETLSSLDKNMQFSQAASLIGKQVTVVDRETESAGIVEKVGYVDMMLKIYVDGNPYDLNQVKSVKDISSGPASGLGDRLIQASLLIGKEITVGTSEGTVTGPVEKVGLVEGKLKLYLNGTPYDVEQVFEIDGLTSAAHDPGVNEGAQSARDEDATDEEVQ